MNQFISVRNLSFTYPNALEPIFDEISLQLDSGWSSIVGPNGSGKTTLLRILCGLLKPDSGLLIVPGKSYYSEQRTDFIPAGLKNLFKSKNKISYKLQHEMQIHENWQYKWNLLSHGERKRCQIAVALNEEPTILAIDEPSNHLDNYSKNILLQALKAFRGIGLLVSHDRELMDALCPRTIFINPPKIHIRKCSYSIAALELEQEIQNQNADYQKAKVEVKKLKKKVQKQSEKAVKADKQKSKFNINPKDHDAKSKKDLARLTGKDSIEGQKHKRLQSKLAKAQTKQNSIHFKKMKSLGIAFDPEESSRFFPIIISSASISLGKEKKLNFPELSIQSGEKIGIIGDNGAGKSTFLNYFLKVAKIKSEKLVFIPQEITMQQSTNIIHRIKKIRSDKKGQMMTIISRLGSEPSHVLNTSLPSPGEVRKLMLAEGIMSNPGIIIMDEPTNHMDLVSIECIEQALIECSCAQLLVSHDRTFLTNTVHSYWSFIQENKMKIMVDLKSDLH